MQVSGGRIARIRQAIGWTQADLAERAGVTPATIAAYEQGRRNKLDTLREIARAPRVDLSVLLGTGIESGGDPAVDALCAAVADLDPAARDELLRLARMMAARRGA
jgi:transcriptional regulator with XRE-family HTH domain